MNTRMVKILVPGYSDRTRDILVEDMGGGVVRTPDHSIYQVCQSCHVAKRANAFSHRKICRKCHKDRP